MDAQTLYRQGVLAIRDKKDIELGRELLLHSLQRDPNNDMAWLWLTHTVTDVQKRLDYVERALKINPANEHALRLKQRLARAPAPLEPPPARVIRPLQPKIVQAKGQKLRIQSLLVEGEALASEGDIEAALARWVEILKIQVDHEIALRHAVGHLWRLRRTNDAKALVWRALDSGTRVPSVYLTAIDMAEREADPTQAEALRERIAALPAADEKLILTVAERHIQAYRLPQAIQFLQRAAQTHPRSQKILVRLGDLQQEVGQSQDAIRSYEQAVRLGARTPDGKEADKKLLNYVPVLTDRERGSVWLAVREAVGITIFFLLMGWQDAGLNLLALGPQRWLGVLLALLGGYLLVTATSSPQQDPIATWFGGQRPSVSPPPEIHPLAPPSFLPAGASLAPEASPLPIIPLPERYVIGIGGVVLLGLAFVLVLHRALDLVIDHPPPYLPW